MEYIRKDKNGETVTIKISYKEYVYASSVVCRIYKNKIVKRFWWSRVIEDNVYTEEKGINCTINWNCKEFENWANDALSNYNDRLLSLENTERVKTLVKNGCK